jgi:hypothetical protein
MWLLVGQQSVVPPHKDSVYISFTGYILQSCTLTEDLKETDATSIRAEYSYIGSKIKRKSYNL